MSRYEERDLTAAPSEAFAPNDRLGLSHFGVAGRIRIDIGSVDLSRAFKRFSTSGALNRISTAELVLDEQDPRLALADLSGEVTVTQELDASENTRRIFTGTIMTAQSEADGLHLNCVSMPEFGDRLVKGMQYSNNARLDVMYALVRSAGIPSEKTRIEGLAEQSPELFAVTLPVHGVVVDKPIRFGSVLVQPASAIELTSWCRDVSEGMLKEFSEADAVATHFQTNRIMYDAESAGVAAVDVVLAWLLVRSRNTAIRSATGTIRSWNRDVALTLPRRSSAVSVRGCATGRRWVRYLDDPLKATRLEVDRLTRPLLHDRIDQTLQQAMLAASRAINSSDLITSVTSLWEAIEYYVGATAVPDMFEKTEMKSLKKLVSGQFSGAKQERVLQMIGQLNNPPLLARLRHRLALDGVSLSEIEFSLLTRLRSVRNNVAHGQSARPPTEAEVRYGIAIVARMVTAAVHRAASDLP